MKPRDRLKYFFLVLLFEHHGMFSVLDAGVHKSRFARQVIEEDVPEGDRQAPALNEADTFQIVLLGDEVSFDCSVESEDVTEVSIWWQKDGLNLTAMEDKYSMEVSKNSGGVVSSQLIVSSIDWEDAGVYNCRARDGTEGRIEKNKATLSVQAKPVNVGRSNGSGNVTGSLEVSCIFEGKPLPAVTWLQAGNVISEDPNKYEITEDNVSDKTVKSLLKILNLDHGDNGTYLCHGKNAHNSNTAIVEALVLDVPQVAIDHIVAVSSSKLYINWTVVDWNTPVTGYILSYREEGTNEWKYHIDTEIDSYSTSYLMSNLSSDKSYSIKMAAKNDIGTGQFNEYHQAVKTLNFDPVFIPEVSIKGITKNSISVGWNDPPEKFREFIHFYRVSKYHGDHVTEYLHTLPYPLHLWSDLQPASKYKFTVAACNEFSGECSPPSEVIPGETYDGLSGPPNDVIMMCRSDNISEFNWVDVKWQKPLNPNGNIEFYNIELTGRARYLEDNKLKVVSVEPQTKTEDSKSLALGTRFDFLEANTNYSVRVCAVTRSQECGAWKAATCAMSVMPPSGLSHAFTWNSEKREDRNIFKLLIPRLSQRNGKICCIKVVVVVLSRGQATKDLPHQNDIKISDYASVHKSGEQGAYIAEVINTQYMGREIEIGDGKSIAALGIHNCPACSPYGRERRFTDPEPETGGNNMDGFLDDNRNYTAFVEIVMEDGVIGRSPYLEPRRPGVLVTDISKTSPNTVLVSVLGILAGLVLVALILMVVLFMLRRYSKQVAAQQGVELDLKHTFRHFCSTIKGRGHSQFLLTQDHLTPHNLPPVDKKGMVKAYLERHKDSDYGFQAEFESLPEKFTDRTTTACDLPCNKTKNRYPDIRSYDQTRVKLNPIEDIEGSDYINANFVVGYKERKRWVCAQGPLESTLGDFWRMIHEQGVEIVIMLTNLEEYNRVKCAQYWPGAGSSTWGRSTVAFVQEKRYSDYIVRELKLTVEGAAGPRQIFHYHYLQWKDFNAPEHAPAMLKFVKRINEAWSGSSPILVHCSAGVGRSGTLIAIDSLTQAMEEEGSVSIFQTVSDLRRQRNYLVQSVKQYQFVYRAIMEWSQFGDTEMTCEKIKEHWMNMAQEKDKLKNEFARLANVVDDRKALSVATNAENQSKNGSDSVIPYDRNRVILTPDGARPHSTYINASFIEGYFNDESFIITQDPLQETALDFWRMVVEHNVATMVMLSDSDGGSWQYWPSDEMTGDRTLNFGYMTVTLVSRESRVSYVKREFKVANTKAHEELNLTHFSYNEWPGTSEDTGLVPSSTHGLLGLVEHALAHQEEASLTGPIAVHCRYGSDRSSLYVGLSILVQQIKREGRCDVFTAVRKLRAQRQAMMQHLPMYEFLYRAISDYVDLYKNKDEEYEYSVPVGAVPNNGTTKSAKSIQSTKSLKSNGSGPYCVPVGSNGTGTSGSGSNTSVS